MEPKMTLNSLSNLEKEEQIWRDHNTCYKTIYKVKLIKTVWHWHKNRHKWVDCRPINEKLHGLVPSQGTCLGGRIGPWLGAWERQPIDVSLTHQCFFLSLSSSLPTSLEMIA